MQLAAAASNHSRNNSGNVVRQGRVSLYLKKKKRTRLFILVYFQGYQQYGEKIIEVKEKKFSFVNVLYQVLNHLLEVLISNIRSIPHLQHWLQDVL